jgi:acyl dehydratase
MSIDTLTAAADAVGLDLGVRPVTYDEDDVILYALGVGAGADDLDLVFERDLRVLPTFGLTLTLWAADELGSRGFFSSTNALHAAQRLEVLAPLAPRDELELSARVAAVWDKGSAAIFEIEVSCERFRAVSSIFAPGLGGWGGERGPSARRDPESPPARLAVTRTSPDQAVLYRLTGDKHLIHVDPEAAAAIGAPGPIMHGLSTLGFAVRGLAGLCGSHPADLAEIECRFLAPVLPGARLEIRAWDADDAGYTPFAVGAAAGTVLGGGRARFA